MADNPRQLVLASSSPYRRELLDRLGLEYLMKDRLSLYASYFIDHSVSCLRGSSSPISRASKVIYNDFCSSLCKS